MFLRNRSLFMRKRCSGTTLLEVSLSVGVIGLICLFFVSMLGVYKVKLSNYEFTYHLHNMVEAINSALEKESFANIEGSIGEDLIFKLLQEEVDGCKEWKVLKLNAAEDLNPAESHARIRVSRPPAHFQVQAEDDDTILLDISILRKKIKIFSFSKLVSVF